jgi:hypothetical protein
LTFFVVIHSSVALIIFFFFFFFFSLPTHDPIAQLAAGYRIPIGAADLDAQEAAGDRDRAALAAAGGRYGPGSGSGVRFFFFFFFFFFEVKLILIFPKMCIFLYFRHPQRHAPPAAANPSVQAADNVDWEAEQTARAAGKAAEAQAGADAKSGFVGDTAIDFILEARLPGTFSDAKLAAEQRIQEEARLAARAAADRDAYVRAYNGVVLFFF